MNWKIHKCEGSSIYKVINSARAFEYQNDGGAPLLLIHDTLSCRMTFTGKQRTYVAIYILAYINVWCCCVAFSSGIPRDR